MPDLKDDLATVRDAVGRHPNRTGYERAEQERALAALDRIEAALTDEKRSGIEAAIAELRRVRLRYHPQSNYTVALAVGIEELEKLKGGG